MSYIPEAKDISEYIDQTIDYWMEKIKMGEPPEYHEFKQKPETKVLLEFLEGFEKHFVKVGVCIGVGLVNGFLKNLEKNDVPIDRGDKTKD